MVKVPRDECISAAWLNEFLALTALPTHPNILPMLCCVDGSAFANHSGIASLPKPPLVFVTKFAANGSAEQFCKRAENTGKAVGHLLTWALDIASGLAHLHNHGCVHRDVAARNIFIDDNERAILADFGLARPLDAKEGVFESEGTESVPCLADPRALRTKKYSCASDVFSYGLTLIEIASEGKMDDAFAFSRSSSEANASKLEQMARNGYAEVFNKLRLTMPAWLVKLTRRCLALDPAKRPSARQICVIIESPDHYDAELPDVRGGMPRFESRPPVSASPSAAAVPVLAPLASTPADQASFPQSPSPAASTQPETQPSHPASAAPDVATSTATATGLELAAADPCTRCYQESDACTCVLCPRCDNKYSSATGYRCPCELT